MDVARHYIERPNALEEGHYVLRLSAFSQNAPTQTLIIDLWVSGRFAEAGDWFMPRPLAGIVLKPLLSPRCDLASSHGIMEKP